MVVIQNTRPTGEHVADDRPRKRGCKAERGDDVLGARQLADDEQAAPGGQQSWHVCRKPERAFTQRLLRVSLGVSSARRLPALEALQAQARGLAPTLATSQ